MNQTPSGLKCWRIGPRWRSVPLWLGMLVLLVLTQPSWAQEGQKGEAPASRGAQSPVNRLAKETSPYLRQHAHNPVDWYPWGPEALERARRENKPIFLSIGYSACHWCHVMAHESFENPEIARIMNENFINIKVDREERPDLDETYMKAVVMVTGQGGWPMSVFLTPDLQPFFGGTYFSPKKFKEILLALSKAYRQDQAGVVKDAQQLQRQLQTLGRVPAGAEPGKEILARTYSRLNQIFDTRHGGFGDFPKFPEALDLNFLLHYYRFAGVARAREMVSFTLTKMAQGGIYDQLGGGFHRYSTDALWLLPHFEKMLYDNALLAPLYLADYQLTGSDLGRRVVAETLDFVIRDLGAPGGGFFAALDSQSEGREGKYYLWTLSEVRHIVGEKATPLVTAALGITSEGNFEDVKGANILTRPLTIQELAARFSLKPEQVSQSLDPALEQLRRVRAQRVPPGRDDKIIVAWNGLTISALAQGAQVLGEPRYYQAAVKAAHFILQHQIKEGQLYRIWARGRISVPGFLEDYAFLANGLLDLFETDFDPFWLTEAGHLVDRMNALFLDPAAGMYFNVAKDQKTPLVRSLTASDQAIPSGNSMAAYVCWRLYRFTGKKQYQQRAQAILSRFQGQVLKNPLEYPFLLTTQTLFLTPALDITVVGDPKQDQVKEMLQEIYARYLPERRMVLKNPREAAALEKVAPEMRDYPLQGGVPTAYICRNFMCLPPITKPQELATKLAQLMSQKAGP
jgi:uncharacterized protein YyaL (SSP411 family)